MADLSVLEVALHGERIGTLTRLPGDQIVFVFDQAYLDDSGRSTLSLSFKDDWQGFNSNFPPSWRLPVV